MDNTPQDEGLAGSVAIYLAALIAAASAFLVPAYLMLAPIQHENLGLAAYKPPPGTRVLPAVNANRAEPLRAVADEARFALDFDRGAAPKIAQSQAAERQRVYFSR